MSAAEIAVGLADAMRRATQGGLLHPDAEGHFVFELPRAEYHELPHPEHTLTGIDGELLRSKTLYYDGPLVSVTVVPAEEITAAA